ncbi:endonuclease V [Dactylosporangium sp. NPDC051485]|uniref:endonuclease V n=1 Tax=Dactylosporangium sp. NPDC051485 TaxID=3154846 RepID=UPI003447F1BB
MTRTGAVDVQYFDTGGARAALVVGAAPTFDEIVQEHVCRLAEVAPYEPGSFYKRELPAIRAVLAGVEPVELLVVDGYVDLDPDGRPGLGARAHADFGLPVIGVAKTAFRTATHAAEIRRGGSDKPLYVTAAGLPVATAADYVRRMRGEFRLPDALRRVDALARGRA